MGIQLLQLLLVLRSISASTDSSSSYRLHEITNQSKQVDTTVYSVVQVPPKFPGGNEALLQFIQSASQYPVNLKKGSLVQLRLLIEKDGSISSVQVAYADVDDKLIEEAKRIAKLMPKWIAGSQDGRLLRVYTLVPIRFLSTKKT